MRPVVFRLQPSVHAAYRAHTAPVGTSVVSVSNTRQEIEPHPSAALVRESAHQLAPLIEPLGGNCAPGLCGSQVKMIEGHCLEASEPRLKRWRGVAAGALPGQSLVVSAPQQGVGRDVLPCEDGHAPARALVGGVLKTVQADDLWMAERHGCPRDVLCDMDHRGAAVSMREHRGLPCDLRTPLRPLGRVETGHMAEQRVRVVDGQGVAHPFRRLRLTLDHATRDGARWRSLVTHVPARQAAAQRVAGLYRKRWTLETALQHLEAYFHADINTLGYPQAALCGFCLALVASNLLAVVCAA